MIALACKNIFILYTQEIQLKHKGAKEQDKNGIWYKSEKRVNDVWRWL